MVELSFIDSAIIIFFLLLVLVIGFSVSKTSSKNTSQYFLSGRTIFNIVLLNNSQLLLFGLPYMPFIKDSIDVIYTQLNIFLHML